MDDRNGRMKKAGGRAATPPGVVRIIGGQWRRSVLPVIDAAGLRPTPDRVRETVFNWLTHAFGGSLEGVATLDLFAGSGALGFEAASRGAAPVVFVDDDRAAIAAMERARDRLHAEAIEIVAGDALRVGGRMADAGRRFDIVFVDPPYAGRLLPVALPLAARLVADDGFVYVEDAQPLPADLVEVNGFGVYRTDKAGGVFYDLLQRKK